MKPDQKVKNAAEPREWYRIKNKADDSSVAQIDIYDEIDAFWGVGAAEFRNELKSLDGIKTIDLHINSPGGSVYEAIAIMNSLRQHDARVVTTVDSLAASSAGFIAVGASDELIMAEHSELMAHLPWAVTIGDAADMRKMADDLDRIGKNIASIFAARTGGDLEEWTQMLTAETWWSAEEAVEAGIADSVLKSAVRVDVKNHFDLSVFNHAGRANAPAPFETSPSSPSAVEAEVNKGKEAIVATLNEGLAQKLGIATDADDETINAALEAALAERPEAEPEPAPEPTIEQATQIAAQAGLTLVSNEALTALQNQAREGAEARAQQVRESHERIINMAVEQGKIVPASREHWLTQIAADPTGISNVIAGLPAVLPLAELGHGVSNEITNEDDALYASIFGTPAGKDA